MPLQGVRADFECLLPESNQTIDVFGWRRLDHSVCSDRYELVDGRDGELIIKVNIPCNSDMKQVIDTVLKALRDIGVQGL